MIEKANAVLGIVEFMTKLTSCTISDDTGWKVGKEDGLESGWSDGCRDGRDVGWSLGRLEGRVNGCKEGLREG